MTNMGGWPTTLSRLLWTLLCWMAYTASVAQAGETCTYMEIEDHRLLHRTAYCEGHCCDDHAQRCCSDGHGNTFLIIGIILAGVVFLGVVILVIVVLCKRSALKRARVWDSETTGDYGTPLAVREIYYAPQPGGHTYLSPYSSHGHGVRAGLPPVFPAQSTNSRARGGAQGETRGGAHGGARDGGQGGISDPATVTDPNNETRSYPLDTPNYNWDVNRAATPSAHPEFQVNPNAEARRRPWDSPQYNWDVSGTALPSTHPAFQADSDADTRSYPWDAQHYNWDIGKGRQPDDPPPAYSFK